MTDISQTYLTFAAAVVLLCVIPGPDMVYLLGRTLTQGRRAGLVAALGMNRLLGGLFVALGLRLATEKL